MNNNSIKHYIARNYTVSAVHLCRWQFCLQKARTVTQNAIQGQLLRWNSLGTTYSDIIISVSYMNLILQRFSNRKKQIYTGALNSWKFPGLPGFAHGYFSKKNLWAFVPMVPSESVLVSSCRPPYILFLYQHSFARNFRLQFSVGLWTPNFGEGEGVGGRGWYRTIRKSVGEFL